MKPNSQFRLLVVACGVLYLLTSYGGTRSPDSEIVFRSAEAFARSGTLAVDRDLELWPGFGLAPGRDGRRYPVFGPLESIALAPVVAVASQIAGSPWFSPWLNTVPISHYCGQGVHHVLDGTVPTDWTPHAVRFLTSFFNPLVTMLQLLVLGLILGQVRVSHGARLITVAAYGLGSLAWPYSGTFLSEPLGTLLLLMSVWALLATENRNALPEDNSMVWRQRSWRFMAGVFQALSCAAHVSGLMSIPFLAWLCAATSGDKTETVAGVPTCATPDQAGPFTSCALWRRLAPFVLGLALGLSGLMSLQYAHFGSPFETGRSVLGDEEHRFGYGKWWFPWPWLYELCLGGGKGLLIYCPIVLLGLAGWRAFHRRRPGLSWAIGGLAVTRWLVIAARSDWDGGYCVGPRYLVMAVPLLLLPLAFLWDELQTHRWGRRCVVGFSWVCILEQWYFSLGEVFSLYQANYRAMLLINNTSPFAGQQIFRSWSSSPVINLWHGQIGPWPLQTVGLDLPVCFALGAVLLTLLIGRLLSECENAAPSP